MKKAPIILIPLFLVLVLFLAVSPSDHSHAGSSIETLSGPGAVQAAPGAWDSVWRGSGVLHDLTCIDDQTCIAVGDAGMFLKTVNSGESWHFEVLDVDHDYYAITFSNAERGLLVGQGGHVYLSEDGGATWRSGEIPEAVDLYAVSLQNDGHAWTTGQGGAIFHSTDWGATWSRQTSSTTHNLRAIQFVDSAMGFAVGDEATVLGTIDGGVTWSTRASTYPSWANIYTLSFTSDQLGWIAGQAGFMRRTTDGGNSWQTVTTGLEDDSIDILDLHFAETTAVLGGITGVISTSEDGIDWVQQTSIDTNTRNVNAVHAFNSTNIWAGGGIKANPDFGVNAWWINHSDDGVNFQRSAGDFGLYPHLEAISFPSKDVAYVAGRQSSIGKTTDGGQTWSWQQLTDDTTHYFSGISCPTIEKCWAAGRYGWIHVTDDGGQTWNVQQAPGYGAPFYDILMLDEINGHAAGNPVMYRTTDGGETWLETVTEGDNANVDVSMISNYEGWTATKRSAYRWTTSAGQTWRRDYPPDSVGGSYRGVHVLDIDQNGGMDLAWLVGCKGILDPVTEDCPIPQEGRIIFTPDSGDTWKLQTLPDGTLPLTDIFMSDAKHGWLGGYEGSLLYTSDGGASWEHIPSSIQPGYTLITELDFVDASHGMATAYGGYVIRFSGPGRAMGSYNQAGPIEIDGSPDDWYQGGQLYLDADNVSTVLGDEPWPLPLDISARTYSRWTVDTLYLLVEITDNIVVTDGEDAIQVAIDGLGDGQWGGADDHLLTIGADGSVNDDLHPDQSDAFSASVGLSNNGWTVEIAAPASFLGRASLVETDGVGFNIALDDDDGGGVEHTLLLEGRQIDANPATFGQIRLFGSTMVYQQGQNGYGGVVDTYLSGWEPDVSYADNSRLQVRFQGDVLVRDALLYFDLAGLPTDATILEANLELNMIATTLYGERTISTFRLLQNWDPAATWNSRTINGAWGLPGAQLGGFDYDPTPLDTVIFPVDGAGGPKQWSVIDAITAWLQNPAENHGLLVAPTAGEGRDTFFYSSDDGTQTYRPKLTVRFALQPRPIPPTPTATATPTATPSPTPTITPSPTPEPASVFGIIYEDVNENDQMDEGEPPITGALVTLTGEVADLQITTESDGKYFFDLLASGNYQLDVTPPPMYGPSYPSTPLGLLLSSGNNIELNFGHVYRPRLFMPMILR